jgi:hypothetical protein
MQVETSAATSRLKIKETNFETRRRFVTMLNAKASLTINERQKILYVRYVQVIR